MTPPLAIRWDRDVCHVTLSRPTAGNALSAELVHGMVSAVDDCVARQARGMVLRGEGKHFCTGFDLARLDQESDDSLLARLCRVELMLQKVHRAPFPTLAIAQGRVLGAGADLFAACRHRLAARGTQFAFPGAAGFGLVLGTRRLVQCVGVDRARRWVTTGMSIGLDEALASGLASGALEDGSAAEAIRSCVDAEPAAGAGNPLLASVLDACDPIQDHLDLAMLIRSAAVPGLKARIAAYVERSMPART